MLNSHSCFLEKQKFYTIVFLYFLDVILLILLCLDQDRLIASGNLQSCFELNCVLLVVNADQFSLLESIHASPTEAQCNHNNKCAACCHISLIKGTAVDGISKAWLKIAVAIQVCFTCPNCQDKVCKLRSL